MTDVLIRNVSAEALAGIDAHASALGLSRAEYLRRQIEQVGRRRDQHVTEVDFDRFGQLARDLDDDAVMRQAWG